MTADAENSAGERLRSPGNHSPMYRTPHSSLSMTGFGRRTLAGIVALFVTACGQAAPGPEAKPETPAQPGLWSVADEDTTIYLFGTIHMLPPGTGWRSPEVDQAMGRSQALYLEADVVSDPAGQAAIVRRLGLLPAGERLSDKLSAEQISRLRVAAGKLGVAMETLEQTQPWYAAVMITNAAIRAAGYSTDGGVEAGLRDDARNAGKEMRYLETMEGQLSALADLPPETQSAYLSFTIDDIDTAAASLGQMVSAWRTGDADGLARVLIEDDMARLPQLKDVLLDRRNAEWARQLAALLSKEPGEFFVAVGAAHLVGPDSVQEHLKTLGVENTRIQ